MKYLPKERKHSTLKNFLILTLVLSYAASAQQKENRDSANWTLLGTLSLNAGQTAYANYPGATDNLGLFAGCNAELVYKKNKIEWTNKVFSQFGICKRRKIKPLLFDVGQLLSISKLNLRNNNTMWYYTLQADYRSQLAPGYIWYDNVTPGRAESDFNSPGYVQLAIGMDFKPTTYFSACLAPLAGKITLVDRQHLADAGAFGVERAVYNFQTNETTEGKKTRTELGGRVILKFRKDLSKRFNLDSYVDLFSNYTNNPGNIDVFINNVVTFKFNRFFTMSLISQLSYDDETIFKRDFNKDGDFDDKQDINGPKLQNMMRLALGFGYTF